jgi:hypothetical protein
MPKRSSKRPKAEDQNETAFRVVREATGKDEAAPAPAREKNPAAVALGRLGGLKGGKARAERLTPEERKTIARQAAQARWKRVS